MKVLFLFIDGVGVREAAPDNPINPEVCPTLYRLMTKHSKSIDACLGVPGLPQSATGQATMFTGVNCAAAMGRHCEGFPGPELRKIVQEKNIFLELKARGKKVKFADAYLVGSPDELEFRRFKSVTTVMALSTPETVSTTEELLNGKAVLQDLTRETIQDTFPDVPVIPPQRAAEQLFSIARDYDFTLFEFFQTDVSGHSQDYIRACSVLRTYDRFLSSLVHYTEASGITLVITADHGNIECVTERGHTLNPVPFIVFGPNEQTLRDHVSSLTDVTPALLEQFDL